MKWAVALRLGRISNVPTVWTNLLAGVVLAGGTPAPATILPLAAALSLVYMGGMYLNDAFDRDVDARGRPERPIPAGQVGAVQVFAAGFGMLGVGVAVAAAQPLWMEVPMAWAPGASAAALAGLVILYDARHKGNPLGPLLMGLCRVGVYVTAAVSVAPPLPGKVVAGSSVLLAYVMGLSFLARREGSNEVRSAWPLALLAVPLVYAAPSTMRSIAAAGIYAAFLGWVAWAVGPLRRRGRLDVPRAVVSLVAGISLLDALLMVRQGRPAIAGIAIGCFALTRLLQRHVEGT